MMTARWLRRAAAAGAAVVGLSAMGDGNQLVLDGSTTVGPVAKAFAEYTMGLRKEVNITVSESGSGNGAKSLVNGTCDVATLSRGMKDAEFAAAAQKGIQPVPHVIAYDGIAVVTHPSNPVKALSLEQVRGIYTGKIANWKDVGGADSRRVVTRDPNMAPRCLRAGDEQGRIAAGAETVGSNGAARTRVATTPAAIAYIGIGFIDSTVKALDINSVYPDRDTVASGKYPIARPLFFYTAGYPKLGSLAHTFVTLHLTKKGQEIVESVGFVPVTNY